MNKYACGIVTFHPDKKIIKKIYAYAKQFDKIFIYDNTPGSSVLINRINLPKVEIESNGVNDGLSHAYNWFLKKTSSFDYLCLLDQDSLFSQKNICLIKSYLDHESTNSNIGLLGPQIIFNNTGKVKKLPNISKVNFIISSGTFINLKSIFRKNIFFDENYFIDRVDLDFCTLCRRKGLGVYRYNRAKLCQRLGTGSKNEHGIERHYYIFRNRFYYNKKYLKHYIVYNFLQTVKQCWRILSCEKDKARKLFQLYAAFYDYKKNIMGKGRY